MEIVPRSDAQQRKLPTYFTGVPCKHGHTAARRTINRSCTACNAEKYKQSYHRNERLQKAARDRAKRWRLSNMEKYQANQKKWREQNRPKIRQCIGEWIKANPEAYQLSREARNTRRRTRKKENGGYCAPEDIRALRKRQKGRCANCSKRRKLEIDHMTPVAKGGNSHWHNLQLLCRHCNRIKWAKDPIDWAKENGRLL